MPCLSSSLKTLRNMVFVSKEDELSRCMRKINGDSHHQENPPGLNILRYHPLVPKYQKRIFSNLYPGQVIYYFDLAASP